MDFGKIVKEARKAIGMSQVELGKAVGVTQKTVAAWECNRRNMPLNRANDVFAVLGVSVTIGEGAKR